METAQGSLVIIGANTPDCKVYWNGVVVPNKGVTVENTEALHKVVIKVAEDPSVQEMQLAGITIRRVV